MQAFYSKKGVNFNLYHFHTIFTPAAQNTFALFAIDRINQEPGSTSRHARTARRFSWPVSATIVIPVNQRAGDVSRVYFRIIIVRSTIPPS